MKQAKQKFPPPIKCGKASRFYAIVTCECGNTTFQRWITATSATAVLQCVSCGLAFRQPGVRLILTKEAKCIIN